MVFYGISGGITNCPCRKMFEDIEVGLVVCQKPPIWRQVLVQSDINFQQLPAIIQGVMGWDNAHLHQFTDGNRILNIGIPFDDSFSDTIDGRKSKSPNI